MSSAALLAIESATEACSVALFDGAGGLIAGDWRMLGRGHAEALVPMIAALPGRGRAGRIVVGRGPGSFTGVRIGIAAARALALAWEAELAGFPTLALIAAMARERRGNAPLAVATTAGHGEIFRQCFASDGVPGPLTTLPPDLAAIAAPDLVVGSGAQALVTARGSGEAMACWPDAREVALLSRAHFSADISPLYGRAPDARLPPAALGPTPP